MKVHIIAIAALTAALAPTQAEEKIYELGGPTGPAGVTGSIGPTGDGGGVIDAGATCGTGEFMASGTTCLSVQGGAIPATGRAVLLPSDAFFPLATTTAGPWNFDLGFASRSGGAQVLEIWAPVPLPAGAIPQGFSCVVSDSASGGSDWIEAELMVHTSPATATSCGSADQSADGDVLLQGGETCTDAVNEDLTSPSFRAYSMRVKSTTTTNNLVKLFGCKVKYSISALGN